MTMTTTTIPARTLTPVRMMVNLPAHAGAARVDEVPAAPAAPDADAPGCGWYDSSFELRHGLDVIELGPAAAGFFCASLS